jgi:hypothetical protein
MEARMATYVVDRDAVANPRSAAPDVLVTRQTRRDPASVAPGA